MKEQLIKINIDNSFELKDIFECGQCFRWDLEDDNSYTGVFNNSVVNVKKDGKTVTFKGVSNRDLKELVEEYFDLKTDYKKIKNELSKIDSNLADAVEFGDGIRILNQDLWETIISFIISANNNIPRIKKIINTLSKQYGKEIIFNNKKYYSFPTPKELGKASVEDLRKTGLGFRDVRIFNTTKMINDGVFNLEKLKALDDTKEIENNLLKLDGVGPKVANCIMLFALKRYDSFPIDVWVRRVMNDLYFKYDDEEKLSKKEIEKFAKENFKDKAGLAQQYLFYWRREEK